MKRAPKAVAIPYIVALVIGLIVIAFVVYWVYRTASTPTLSLQQCKSRYITWCSNCAQINWPDWYCMPPGVWECKDILRNAGLTVPQGDCSHTPEGPSIYPRCNETEVKRDCAALGVCLNNPEC